jgi:hypothetical protein
VPRRLFKDLPLQGLCRRSGITKDMAMMDEDDNRVTTPLGRAVQEQGKTGLLTQPAEHHPKTNWLRDVILGGQDGLANIL